MLQFLRGSIFHFLEFRSRLFVAFRRSEIVVTRLNISTATMPALWYYEYITLAQLELDCKNTEKAAEYASLAAGFEPDEPDPLPDSKSHLQSAG